MRIIAKRTLREFWVRHPAAEQPLKAWHAEAKGAEWATPAQIKAQYRFGVRQDRRGDSPMHIKVIKTEAEYDRALARVDELMDAKAGTTEGDELELLVTLIGLYEDKVHPVDLPDPLEAIRFRMDQSGLRQQDLVPYLGSRSRVSEVMNGKRPLTLKMIRALHAGLNIPAEVLIQQIDAAPSGKA